MTKTFLKLAAGLIIATTAFASTADATEFSVSYSKSELTSVAGAAQVYQRILETSEDLCDLEFSQFASSKTKLRFERCLRRTTKEFVSQVDHPFVDQVHAALPFRRNKHQDVESIKLAKNNTK